MTKEEVAYQEWLKDVSGKLPEDLRPQFEAVTDSDAGKELFRAVGRREDYNRRVNEVEDTRRQLNSWWEQEKPRNEKLLAELARKEERLAQREATLKELGFLDDPGSGRTPTPPSVVKKDDLTEFEKRMEARIASIDRALPAFLGDFSETIYRIGKEGYSISPKDVLQHSMENNVSTTAALDVLTSVERDKRAKDAAVKEQEKWKEEGRREAISKLNNPAQMRPAGPNILDTLRDKEFRTDQRSRVDASVKEFLEGDFSNSGGLV